MKTTYQKPNIRVRRIETENMLAASPGVSGNTVITNGFGSSPSDAQAKPFSIFDDPEPSKPSSGIGW